MWALRTLAKGNSKQFKVAKNRFPLPIDIWVPGTYIVDMENNNLNKQLIIEDRATLRRRRVTLSTSNNFSQAALYIEQACRDGRSEWPRGLPASGYECGYATVPPAFFRAYPSPAAITAFRN